MSVLEIIVAVIIALLIGAAFFYGFKIRGPWGSFWTFILVVTLGIILVTAIAEPLGPVWWGITILDMLIIGLLFAVILAAATPGRADIERHQEYYASKRENKEEDHFETRVNTGTRFWSMVIFFILLAIIAIFIESGGDGVNYFLGG